MVVEGGFGMGRVSPEIRSQMTTIRLMVRNGDEEEEEEDAMPVDGDGDVAEFLHCPSHRIQLGMCSSGTVYSWVLQSNLIYPLEK